MAPSVSRLLRAPLLLSSLLCRASATFYCETSIDPLALSGRIEGHFSADGLAEASRTGLPVECLFSIDPAEKVQVSHKSLTSLSHKSLSQVSHKSLTSLSPVSHQSLTSLSHKSLSQVSLTRLSHKSLTSLSQVSHKSLTPHSSPPCQTPLSPPLHHTERISSQISSIRFNFAHPPISPICRTPLFPYLTFDSRFLRSLPSASTRPLRRLGPATSSSFMAT